MENKKEKLILLPYKEPLKPIPKGKGFGYYGTIAETADGNKIQCHVCGELKRALVFHIYNKHQIDTHDYKKMYMLAKETTLTSRQMKIERKKIMSQRWANKSQLEKRIFIKRLRKSVKNKKLGYKQISLETRNKRGNCPDQMIDKVKKLVKKLGRTPTQQEYKNEYKTSQVNLIIKLFGSWANLLKRGKIKRLTGRKKPVWLKRKYTRKELLGYLRNFHKKTGQIPMQSDCHMQRGFLPSYSTYNVRFGGLPRARRLAGIK